MIAHTVEVVKEALLTQMQVLSDEIYTLGNSLSEEQFWRKPLVQGNSIGHLVLHLAGNLNHFIGAGLAKTGYVRDREREFTEQQVPSKAEALQQLQDAVALYRRVVESQTVESLAAPHPETEKMGTTINALVKTLTHLAVHRGQMSYLVRLL